MAAPPGEGLTMALMDSMRSFFGAKPADPDAPAAPAMPDVAKLVEASDACKPPNYASEITRALAYLRNDAGHYAQQALAKNFPGTARFMAPIDLGMYRRFIVEQSRALAGDWTLTLDGASDDEAALWQAIQDAAHLRRKLNEAARRANSLRKVFVRATWDDRRKVVVLTLFAPHLAHLPYTAHTHGVDDLDALALELEPVRDGTQMRKRRQVWTRGENAQVWIVDEKGKALDSGPNPYADDAGASIIPLVEFSTVDLDDGRWPLPDQQLLGAAEAINAQLTNAWHVAKLGIYGQPISQRVGEMSADEWPGEVPRGPEVIIDVPKGRTYTVERVDAGVEKLDALVTSLIGQVEASASLPPGSVLAGSRTVPSGAALLIERAPLDELRQDHLDMLTPSILRLADVIRWVWNAHQPSNATRLLRVKPVFSAGEVRPPLAPDERSQLDESEIRIGVSSPVRVLMRDRGLTREAALAEVAAIAEENGVVRGAQLRDAGRAITEPLAHEPPDAKDDAEEDATEARDDEPAA